MQATRVGWPIHNEEFGMVCPSNPDWNVQLANLFKVSQDGHVGQYVPMCVETSPLVPGTREAPVTTGKGQWTFAPATCLAFPHVSHTLTSDVDAG